MSVSRYHVCGYVLRPPQETTPPYAAPADPLSAPLCPFPSALCLVRMPSTGPIIFVVVFRSIKRSQSRKSEQERSVFILLASAQQGPVGWPCPWPVALLLSRCSMDLSGGTFWWCHPLHSPLGAGLVTALRLLAGVPALSLMASVVTHTCVLSPFAKKPSLDYPNSRSSLI